MADTVGRNLKAVFRKRYQPAYKDYPYKGFILEFQMAVPGKGHKDIGNRQKNDGFHLFAPERKKLTLFEELLNTVAHQHHGNGGKKQTHYL